MMEGNVIRYPGREIGSSTLSVRNNCSMNHFQIPRFPNTLGDFTCQKEILRAENHHPESILPFQHTWPSSTLTILFLPSSPTLSHSLWFIILFLFFEATPGDVWVFSWIYTQESLSVVLWGAHKVLGSIPGYLYARQVACPLFCYCSGSHKKF